MGDDWTAGGFKVGVFLLCCSLSLSCATAKKKHSGLAQGFLVAVASRLGCGFNAVEEKKTLRTSEFRGGLFIERFSESSGSPDDIVEDGLEDVRVVVKRLDVAEGALWETVTAEDGSFKISGLDDGLYGYTTCEAGFVIAFGLVRISRRAPSRYLSLWTDFDT